MRPLPSTPRPQRLIFLYSLAHAWLAVTSLSASAALKDAYGISRAALQIVSAASLIPSVIASDARAPTLAALAGTISLFVDGVLRALAAAHQIVHASGALRSTPRYVLVSALQAGVSTAAAAAAAPRALSFLRGMDVVAKAPLAPPPPSSDAAAGGGAKASAADDLGMVLVLVHGVSCVAARVADVAAALGGVGPGWLALVDACAAAFCVWILVGPIRMLCDILLQATPRRLQVPLRSRMDRVAALEGVVTVGRAHFWEETPGVCVGTVAVTVSRGVRKSSVVGRVHACFEGVVETVFVQVEELATSAGGEAVTS